jgi:hypothetical protein
MAYLPEDTVQTHLADGSIIPVLTIGILAFQAIKSSP